MKEVKCPGKKLVDLLEALDLPNYQKIERALTENVYERLRRLFQGSWNGEIKKLYIDARRENLRDRRTYVLAQAYIQIQTSHKKSKNPLSDFSSTLGKHVQDCRGKGKCFDKYMLWLEEKAREVMREEGFNEEELPGIIRRVDLKYLDLSVF